MSGGGTAGNRAGRALSAAGAVASSFSLAAAATSSTACRRALPPPQRAQPACPQPLISGGSRGGRRRARRHSTARTAAASMPLRRGFAGGEEAPATSGPRGMRDASPPGAACGGCRCDPIMWVPVAAAGFVRWAQYCSAPRLGRRVKVYQVWTSPYRKRSMYTFGEHFKFKKITLGGFPFGSAQGPTVAQYLPSCYISFPQAPYFNQKYFL